MKIKFVKYQGCGNDYIYVDCLNGRQYDFSNVAKTFCDRHFGIGADGVVFICKSEFCCAQMRMFNSDGSEGLMCGNAIRCVAKYLVDNKISQSHDVLIQTQSGIKRVIVNEVDGVCFATVNMGKGSVDALDVGLLQQHPMINQPIVVEQKVYLATAVSVGNPHCVIFAQENDFCKVGQIIENNPIFKNKTNVEFAQVVDDYIVVKVWERGTGYTLACGSGACAVVFVAVRNGLAKRNKWINVQMDGGILSVMISDDNTIYLKGDAVKVFEGEIEYGN